MFLILADTLCPCGCWQVDMINELFEQHKDNPPVSRNQPPVAGSIYWGRSLFNRIKHTIVHFLEVPEMLESEEGRAVCYSLSLYLSFSVSLSLSPSLSLCCSTLLKDTTAIPETSLMQCFSSSLFF